MNGEPLPLRHGFPVRMVVPGLYGYVSATKWVVDLEVTRFADAQAYWTRRGWSSRGPVKTQCHIDTPTGSVAAGKVAVAGVAWAQTRGIEAVEVQIDRGAWAPAELAAAANASTWRQWAYAWDATPGRHTFTARATDGAGGPRPAGWRAWCRTVRAAGTPSPCGCPEPPARRRRSGVSPGASGPSRRSPPPGR